MTPKQRVLKAHPKAVLDYYESIPGTGGWFIREPIQGERLSLLWRSPRSAWLNAARRLEASL